MQDADLTGSRDAPNISTLPPDVALFAVKEAVPLLQELQEEHQLAATLTSPSTPGGAQCRADKNS